MKGITNSIQYFPSTATITTMPTTLSYKVGDTLDTSGIVVKMTMDNGVTENPTSLSYSVPSGDITNLQENDTTVTVSAKFNGKTVTTSYGISVVGGILVSITKQGSRETRTASSYILFDDSTFYNLGDTFTMNQGQNFEVYTCRNAGQGHYVYLNDERVSSKNEWSTFALAYTFTLSSADIRSIDIDLCYKTGSSYGYTYIKTYT